MFKERDPRMMLQRRLNQEARDCRDSVTGDDACCATFREVEEEMVLAERPYMRLTRCDDSLPGDGS